MSEYTEVEQPFPQQFSELDRYKRKGLQYE